MNLSRFLIIFAKTHYMLAIALKKSIIMVWLSAEL